MDIESLLSLLRERRSIRRYDAKPVSDDDIKRILEAARWAPNGANLQPWEIIVVKNDEKIRIIRESIYPRRYAPSDEGSFFLVVCGDTRMKEYYPPVHTEETREYTFTVSIAAAIQNMLLAATALGLGSLWRTVLKNQADALRKLLDIPDFVRVMSVIEVGHSAESPLPPPKRRIEEFSHVNQFEKEKIVDSKKACLDRSIHYRPARS